MDGKSLLYYYFLNSECIDKSMRSEKKTYSEQIQVIIIQFYCFVILITVYFYGD